MLRIVWNLLENEGIEFQFLQGCVRGGEQGVDQLLQTAMLRDALDFNGEPGIVTERQTGRGIPTHLCG